MSHITPPTSSAPSSAVASIASLNLAKLKGSERARAMAASPPQAPPLMGSAPTVTQDTTHNATLTQAITPTVDRVRWSGPLATSPTVVGSTQPRGNTNAAGAAFANPRVASMAFDFDGQNLDINLRAYASLTYRIWVNEQASSASLVALPSGTGANAYLHINFGSNSRPSPRRIVVEFEDPTQPPTIFSVSCAPTDTFAFPETPSPRVLLVGDSFARGSGTTIETYSYAKTLGRMMGWADLWNTVCSYPGTGLVHDNSGTVGNYGVRLPYDVLPYAPDLVIVQGSVNDKVHVGSVGPALIAYVTALRATLPNVAVVVTGPLVVAAPDANTISINTEMRAAAATLGVPFVDQLVPAVFTGTGAVAHAASDGNADWARNGSDFTHPSDAGAYALAIQMAGLIGQAISLPGAGPGTSAAGSSGAAIETSAIPKAGGAASVGVASTASASDHVHPQYNFGASDSNLLGWNYDPSLAPNASTVTNGQLQLIRIKVPKACTVTNVILGLAVAGTTMTTGQNFAALYDMSLNLLGVTADQSTAWTTAGVQTMALATPAAVAAGEYYVGFWVRTTGTAPQFNRCLSNLLVNVGCTSANYRYGLSTAALTTAAPATAGTPTPGAASFFAAVS